MRNIKFDKVHFLYIWCLLIIVCISTLNSTAQTIDAVNDQQERQEHVLLVYIDYAKDDDIERYIRSEIPFVSYVRDPHLAQIHILITDQETGSGGRQFNLSFIGKQEFAGQDQNLFYISPQSDTDDQRREGLARMTGIGLISYLGQTNVKDQVEIKYNVERLKSVKEMMSDMWDYWIYSVDLGGGLSAEQSRNAFTINTALRADRVTDIWKFRNELEYIYEEENFTDDEESLKSYLKQWTATTSLVRSLTYKWSAGLFADLYSTTYRNIKTGASIAPAIEYNFFPWAESERRKFTIGYHGGYTWLNYYQETLFDKNTESLFYHSLEVELEMTQPWGNLDIEFRAAQYLELRDKYSLKLDIELAFRISSGFEFVLNSRMESIHDQIYLPKEGASIDEILLKRHQLATTYDIGMTLGFRYTFGSIYNNVINERL